MPTTPLPLLPSPVVPAWQAVRDVLLSDPSLKRLRVDWRVPEDSTFDDDPVEERVTIKLTPKVTNSQREAVSYPTTVRSYTLTIDVRVNVPSDLWDDMANIAWALERAVGCVDRQPLDRVAHERAYGEAGIFDYETELPVDWDQPGRITVTVWRDC